MLNFGIFFIFTANPGEMIQFDEHIFQMGWFNHQLEMVQSPPQIQVPKRIVCTSSNPWWSASGFSLADKARFLGNVLDYIGPSVWDVLRIFQHTPGTYQKDPQPTVYEGIPFIWGLRDSWGMLQGYVGVFLEIWLVLEGSEKACSGGFCS